jgi:putative ABC transport system permease protein
MRNLIEDFRFGLRILLRNPGFTLAACLVLALGIGANTAIFSVVNAVLLRPVPYRDAARIMQVWHVPPAKSFPGMTLFSVSPANYLDWQAQNHSFEQMAAYGFATFNVGGKRPEAIRGSSVAPGFFSILRVQPVLGRTFSRRGRSPCHCSSRLPRHSRRARQYPPRGIGAASHSQREPPAASPRPLVVRV